MQLVSLGTKVRALIIHNLRAGQRDRREEIGLAASRLTGAGWKVDVVPPAEGVDADRILREAVADGLDVAVVAGGDGSLNAAIQALAGRPAALGVIPTGTGNVWAKEMGIPLDVRGATEVLLRGCMAVTDLGQANGRYFLSIAGIGFDASVTRALKPAAKRRLGLMAYVIAAVAEALKLRGEDAILVANGRAVHQRILMVAASNTRLYGGILKMAPEAFVDDGLLDISVFRGRGLRAMARHAIKALLGIHRGDPEAEFFQTSRLLVESRLDLPVQLDGDYFGTTPMEIRVVPRALRVIVPPALHPQFRVMGVG